MISPAGNFKFYVASKPVDFRKGMDGLAAIVQNEFDLDPFSGAIFIFRSKRADRLKLIVWDGTGLVMTYPMITWNHARREALQLFGHVHNNWRGSRNSVNVGVDVWDFMPVTYDDIARRARKLPINKHWSDVEHRKELN